MVVILKIIKFVDRALQHVKSTPKKLCPGNNSNAGKCVKLGPVYLLRKEILLSF